MGLYRRISDDRVFAVQYYGRDEGQGVLDLGKANFSEYPAWLEDMVASGRIAFSVYALIVQTDPHDKSQTDKALPGDMLLFEDFNTVVPMDADLFNKNYAERGGSGHGK